jgi:alanine-alpha-ketoisovalerate/valine-pyruvate aminotransferase
MKKEILDSAWRLQFFLEKKFKHVPRLSFKTYVGFLAIVFLFTGLGIFVYLWFMELPIDTKGLVLMNPIFLIIMGSTFYMVYLYICYDRFMRKCNIRLWFEYWDEKL